MFPESPLHFVKNECYISFDKTYRVKCLIKYYMTKMTINILASCQNMRVRLQRYESPVFHFFNSVLIDT